ncbi:MAG: tetracycline resistance efflux system leader peptide [Candidatus Hodarchaeota archaeon]
MFKKMNRVILKEPEVSV